MCVYSTTNKIGCHYQFFCAPLAGLEKIPNSNYSYQQSDRFLRNPVNVANRAKFSKKKNERTLKNELFTGLVSTNNDEPGEGKHTSKLTMYM